MVAINLTGLIERRTFTQCIHIVQVTIRTWTGATFALLDNPVEVLNEHLYLLVGRYVPAKVIRVTDDLGYHTGYHTDDG